MVKEIVKDIEILTQKSVKFEKRLHQKVLIDLADTALAHVENCAGLAAIQIGEAVKCFVVKNSKNEFDVYINPFIFKHSTEKYKTMEGCLSLEGQREVTRYEWIEIMYERGGKFRKERVSGYRAEVIQHEYDHLFGKLI